METTQTTSNRDAGTGNRQTPAVGQTPLYRHPTHRLLGGVCGGIADYLGIDANLVRILWVVLTLGSAGAGFLAYLALWLLLPVGAGDGGMQTPPVLELNERTIRRAGLVLISLGGLWLLANLGVLPWLWVAFWRVIGLLFWPALLIGAGVLLLNKQLDLRRALARAQARVQAGASQAKGGVHVDRASIKGALHKIRNAIPLKRSAKDRIFLGVCGGIGRALGIDANLVRLIWVAFSIGSIGAGVLLYVAAGLLLPEETSDQAPTYINQEAQDVQIIDGSVM